MSIQPNQMSVFLPDKIIVPIMTSNCVVIERVARHKAVPAQPITAQILALVLSSNVAANGPKTFFKN